MWFAQALGVIDSGNRIKLFQCQVYSWIQVSLALAASTLLLLLGMVFVFNPGVDAALAGFLLSVSIGLQSRLLNLVRVATALSVGMTSVKGQATLIQLQSERYSESVAPPAAWPAAGRALEVQDLSVRGTTSSYWTRAESPSKGIFISLTRTDEALHQLPKQRGDFEELLARAKNASNKQVCSTLEVEQYRVDFVHKVPFCFSINNKRVLLCRANESHDLDDGMK